MTTHSLADDPSPTGRRRREVLAHLRGSDRPLSVAEVASATGLHANTARFHLDALVNDGLAERATEPRETPGRPKVLYSAEGPAPGRRSYGLLAEMLTGFVSSLDDSRTSAIGIGKAWGRHLVERAAPSQHVDVEEALTRLTRLLDSVGFEPEVLATKRGAEIRLHHCPFLEVAEQHTDVVCAIHMGLMQGALDELGAPVETTSLKPFVTPSVCAARLAAGPAHVSAE